MKPSRRIKQWVDALISKEVWCNGHAVKEHDRSKFEAEAIIKYLDEEYLKEKK